MSDKERFESYTESLACGISPELEKIRTQAVEEQVPVIRDGTRQLLFFLIRVHKVRKILEVGTGTGYSALAMWEASDRQAHITTIENYEKRIIKAKENFAKLNAEDYIEFITDDADDVLGKISGSFDMVFMDAAKGQYGQWLGHAVRLLKPGGILVSDNVLHDMDVLESRYAVCRRDRTIHSRMREYMYELTHRDDMETLILDTGDGTAVSVMKNEVQQ